MKKIALLFFIYLFTANSSFAKIYSTEDVGEVRDVIEDIFAKRNPRKILFIIPFDFIIRSSHPAIKLQQENYNSLVKRVFDNINSTSFSYINMLLLVNYPNEITHPTLPGLIDYIQDNKAGLIITSPHFTGKINDIDRFDIWSFNHLKSKKIDLTKGVFVGIDLVFDQRMKKIAGSYPTFYQGLLSYNSDKSNNSPMQVLSTFLVTKLKKMPDIVVAINQYRQDLEILEKQLQILKGGSEFFGILSKLPEEESEDISPEEYLKFWQDFVKDINEVKGRDDDLESESPYAG